MLTFTRITTTHPHYPFVENLLHQSFPENERRNDEDQRRNTDYNQRFCCHLLSDETIKGKMYPIGLVTIWQLEGFYYVEHLATSPTVRNKGYGKQIMEILKERLAGNIIILEVERPEDELSIRRIGFYERCGFTLCTQDYIQPPYRKGGETLPLYLMYAGTDEIDSCYPQIRNELYRHVYGVNCY